MKMLDLNGVGEQLQCRRSNFHVQRATPMTSEQFSD